MNLSTFIVLLVSALHIYAENSTYYNPVISGWHSDPNCIHQDGYYLCVTSTFLYYPGMPVYASRDLINWKLASHVWTRPEQLPDAGRNATWLQGGFFAPTIRYHDGTYYVINVYLYDTSFDGSLLGTLYTSTDPFNSSSWSDPLYFTSPDIDCDLFWDDDGTVYLHTSGIRQQTIDLETGETSEVRRIWNGTGAGIAEGPHIYKRDGWYYLLVAEGGTELGHRSSIARSRDIEGPYENNPANPILTNGNTTEYFQTVGHSEIFEDDNGKFWAMSLATRSGPEWEIYPMGREAVLSPVNWNEGEWPVFTQVRGVMNGWELPPTNIDVPGSGPFNGDPDTIDFDDTAIPAHWYFNHFPRLDNFEVSPEGHPNTLRITPSRANLTGVLTQPVANELSGDNGISFVGRVQEHTFFSFSVDLRFEPSRHHQEAGVTAFLTQLNHIDLGLALSSPADYGKDAELHFILRVETAGTTVNNTLPSSTQTTAVPPGWLNEPIRLQIETVNATDFEFTAAPATDPNARIVLGQVSAFAVSGGSGPFVGNVLGVYATCNGAGSGETCPEGGEAYFGRWRYSGVAQQVDYDRYIPVV